MAQNLNEYLSENPSKGFTSVPNYFANGDFVTYYLRDERCFAQRIDDVLTVYLANESKELVGCKIKGVKHILETVGDFGVTVSDHLIRLGFFFFMGAKTAKEDSEQRRRYTELMEKAKDVALDARQFLNA